MKKLISILLIVTLLVSASALTTGAYSTNEEIYSGDYAYEIIDGKYVRIKRVEEDVENNYTVIFPSEIDGYEVKCIDAMVLRDYEYDPKVIVIPDTVTHIEASAFYGPYRNIHDDCGAWTTSEIKIVILQSGLTSIGDWAFGNCYDLEYISIPDTVTYIGENAFLNCESIEEINLPKRVTIGKGAFKNCDSLPEVTVRLGIKEIPKRAFYSCDSLQKVNIISDVENVNEEYYIVSDLEAIKAKAFYDCANLKSIKTYETVSIGKKAFGYYIDKKGKEKFNEDFKFRVFETTSRNIANSSVLYANKNGCKSEYYLSPDTTKKLTCLEGVKTNLKIDGEKVASWKSSNPEVAKITANGKFKAKTKGTTKLTATLTDGTTYTRKVKVRNW